MTSELSKSRARRARNRRRVVENDDKQRWVVTSTWGQHHVLACDEGEAHEEAEEGLRQMGYADPANMVNDGMTQEWDEDYHGSWEGP